MLLDSDKSFLAGGDPVGAQSIKGAIDAPPKHHRSETGDNRRNYGCNNSRAEISTRNPKVHQANDTQMYHVNHEREIPKCTVNITAWEPDSKKRERHQNDR